MNKERLYLSEEQDQDIDEIISECEENIKIHKKINYIFDILPIIIVIITVVIMVCASFYYGLKGTDAKIVFVKTVVPMVIIVGIISYFFQNRYYKNRDYKTMDIRKRYELVQKICEAFNLSLTDITEEDIESKIAKLKNLYDYGKKCRNKIIKRTISLSKFLLGIIIPAIISTSIYLKLSIIFILSTIAIFSIAVAITYCMGIIIYEKYEYLISVFLVPYGHLIDYSIYWLKFIKEELPEIKDYLKKRESMQDIENYEKEVSIKKFAKVYVEWKNLSSNKEIQVINLLKEESELTIQMLDKRKHFEKLSKELDEKLEKSNSLSEY